VRGTFISYREDDAKPWALLIRDELVQVFGERYVYLDKDALQAGNWRDQLQLALDRCGVVLVVMGKRWLDARDKDGARRLDVPNDVHRQEIATALARKDVTVIPVLVDGSTMPQREELPEDIRALTDQQARSLADRSSHRELDLEVLIRDIERATGAVASPRGSPRRKIVSWPSWLASLVLCFISIYIGMEIDYRHWTWFVFLVLVPAAVVAVLVLRMRTKS
jgi:TIR domain